MRRYSLPSININAETVVLANGKFPCHPLSLHFLDNCQHLVSCDGATNKLVATGRIPHAIVGDCDSLSKENKERFKSIIQQIEEQETNDLTKAINFCVKNGWHKIIILGATGMREDHTIGNISLLSEYMSLADVSMVTDYGIFVAIDNTSLFESYKGQQVSIFPLDSQPISSQGLVYKIEKQIFTRWWQATLNESEGDEFCIETEGSVIVFREFKKNEQ